MSDNVKKSNNVCIHDIFFNYKNNLSCLVFFPLQHKRLNQIDITIILVKLMEIFFFQPVQTEPVDLSVNKKTYDAMISGTPPLHDLGGTSGMYYRNISLVGKQTTSIMH